ESSGLIEGRCWRSRPSRAPPRRAIPPAFSSRQPSHRQAASSYTRTWPRSRRGADHGDTISRPLMGGDELLAVLGDLQQARAVHVHGLHDLPEALLDFLMDLGGRELA